MKNKFHFNCLYQFNERPAVILIMNYSWVQIYCHLLLLFGVHKATFSPYVKISIFNIYLESFIKPKVVIFIHSYALTDEVSRRQFSFGETHDETQLPIVISCIKIKLANCWLTDWVFQKVLFLCEIAWKNKIMYDSPPKIDDRQICDDWYNLLAGPLPLSPSLFQLPFH